jgi:dihydrofolate synthase/folylpolyglutamate synthase
MLNEFQATIDKINSYIHSDSTNTHTFHTPVGLARQEHILELLGNPQNKLKVIHIAGTSGKGSVASYISQILQAQGFKVGLTVSPHLLDVRERVQVNNQTIAQDKFNQYFSEIEPALVETQHSQLGKPTYFEVLMALAFYTFTKEKVDYAVIETGMGGFLDGSNTVNRQDKVAVITKIGFDHTKFLGNTLSLIAKQKAGIIQPQNVTFTIAQKPIVEKVITDYAEKQNSRVSFIRAKANYVQVREGKVGLRYNFNNEINSYKALEINSLANYQVENSALALSVCLYLCQRDKWSLSEDILRKTLLKFSFAGRMSIKKMQTKEGFEKLLILDGAHNPQKMKGFISSLKNVANVEQFAFVIAIKKGKDYKKMLKYITPFAKKIFIARFELVELDAVQIAELPEVIAENLIELDYTNYQIIEDPIQAIDLALQNFPGCIATGSLYLMSEIYTKLL